MNKITLTIKDADRIIRKLRDISDSVIQDIDNDKRAIEEISKNEGEFAEKSKVLFGMLRDKLGINIPDEVHREHIKLVGLMSLKENEKKLEELRELILLLTTGSEDD